MADYQTVLSKLADLGYSEQVVQDYISANWQNPALLMEGAASVGLTKDDVMALATHYGINLSVGPQALLGYLGAFNIGAEDVKAFLRAHITSPDQAYQIAAQYGFTAQDVQSLANYLGMDYSNPTAQTVLANLEQVGITEDDVYAYLQQHASDPTVIYQQAGALGISQAQVDAVAAALGIEFQAGAPVQLAGVAAWAGDGDLYVM